VGEPPTPDVEPLDEPLDDAVPVEDVLAWLAAVD
jgi:hypothetical protein